ncbi:O-antigen ligase family protein, partial [Patescibacteria group bacterium]|nr:O-antigen ligase family protein [Patescibacteria group bacterium]
MLKSLNIIRYLILGGIFILPVTVLIVAESLFFPFITGKNFFFRILVEILLGLWLILAIYDKRYRPKKSWILYFLTAFIAVLILSTIFSANPYRSFWSNYERMEGLITFLHLFAYFLVFTAVLNTEKLWKWFFHISLGVSVIVAFYGIFQLAGKLEIHQGGARLDATLGNASYLAIYMVFHIFLALWYFLKTRDWYKWFYLPVIILETLILYYTATRGAILGFIAGLFITALIVGFFSDSRKIRIYAVSTLVLIVVLTGLFFSLRSSDFIIKNPVLTRFAGISLTETTTQSRFVIWGMSWEGFKERPILGWGPENYNLVFNKYYEPVLWKQEPWFDRAHNVFFDRLTTNGIFGLLAYLGLFGSALYCLLLKRKKYRFSSYDSGVLTGLFAAYFFHNIFVFDNLISLILFFSFLAYIHHRTKDNEIDSQAEVFIKDDYKKPAFSTIAAIAIIFIIYFVNVPGFLTARSLLSAFKETGAGNLQNAFDKFEKAISYDSFGSAEAREHFANFASKVISQPNIENDLKTKIFDSSSSEMKKQIEQAPDDIRYMIFLGALYNKGRQYNQAIEILQKAIELSPKKQQLYFEIGSSYLNIKEYKKAVEVLKTAFDLDPTFDDARKIYAAALIFDGQEEEASGILKEAFGTDIIPDERLIRAYVEIGNFYKVVAIWESLIEQNPNNAQYRVSLAASYLQINEREKAIEQLEKTIELEPKFKQQGEYFINEIRAGRNP